MSRRRHLAAFALAAALALHGCSTRPLPPAADASRKRPANAAEAVELQACRSDLHNTRIAAAEHARTLADRTVEVARLVRQQQALVEHVDAVRSAAAAAVATPAGDARNTLYSLTFPFAGTRVDLPHDQAARLGAAARAAALVVLRGRTDGRTESTAEGRVARARARAVHDWLVSAGVPPARIRMTWQPVGDHAADNTLPEGRAANRRVEVELYPAAPRVADLTSPTTP